MKTITTSAIAALMTAAIGLSAIAPAFAQDAAPAQTQAQNGPGLHFRHGDKGPGQMGSHMGGGGFLSFERGAEAVEIALVRLSHAVDLTAEQQALFDTLKTDALAAAETFSTAVEGLRPAMPQGGSAVPVEGQTAELPDMSQRFENRIAIETAHLAALEAVRPAFTAFFDSLTDEQKAELAPQRPDRNGGPGMFGKDGMRHREGAPQGMHKGPGAPGGDVSAPEAPTNG